MKFHRFVVAVLAALLSINANAGGGFAGATEVTQILNNVQLVMSYAEQTQQTVTQLNQYQTMLKNLQKITPAAQLDQIAYQAFRNNNMLSTYRDLRSSYINGQRVAYSLATADQQFRTAYPAYDATAPLRYGELYADISLNSHAALKNVASIVGLQSEDLENEEGMMRELDEASRTAEGQMGALQAGNQIGMALLSQLQQTRRLQMAQMQAQNAYLGGDYAHSTAKRQALKTMLSPRQGSLTYGGQQ